MHAFIYIFFLLICNINFIIVCKFIPTLHSPFPITVHHISWPHPTQDQHHKGQKDADTDGQGRNSCDVAVQITLGCDRGRIGCGFIWSSAQNK